MENNGFCTGKIPVTGSGIHKTYEESIFDLSRMSNLESILQYEPRGLYYEIDDANLWWLDEKEYEEGGIWNEIQKNPGNFIKLRIINIVPLNNELVLLELINPSILNNHLLCEAQEKEGYQRELK